LTPEVEGSNTKQALETQEVIERRFYSTASPCQAKLGIQHFKQFDESRR